MRIFPNLFRGNTQEQERIEPAVMAAQTSGTQSPSAWMQDIGWGAQGGNRALPQVNANTAERHGTVFSCCNVIAGDLSKIPMQVMQRGANGDVSKVESHAANYLLNVESSPGVPAITARFALIYSFTLRGMGYAFCPRDGAGELMMIETIRPDLMSVLRSGRARFYDFEDGAGVNRRVAGRAMTHMRYMAEDGWTGRSPIQVASETMGIALAGQNAAAKNATGAQFRAVAKMDGAYGDDETRLRNEKALSAALLNPDGGIPIIGSGDDIKSLDISAADKQLLESLKFDREQIAGMYRMPPSKIQLLEHGVKANGQQQAVDYRTDCLLHWGGFAASQMGLGILTEAERRKKLFLQFDYDALMAATMRELVDALTKAVGGPIMLVPEARKIAKLPALKDGEMPYPPSNMTRDIDEKDEKIDD